MRALARMRRTARLGKGDPWQLPSLLLAGGIFSSFLRQPELEQSSDGTRCLPGAHQPWNKTDGLGSRSPRRGSPPAGVFPEGQRSGPSLLHLRGVLGVGTVGVGKSYLILEHFFSSSTFLIIY